MKILIFSTAYRPLIGGAEIAIKEITDRLPDHQFDLICAKIKRGLASQEKIGNINVYRVGWGSNLDKLFLPVLGFFKSWQLHRENNYDRFWVVMASYASLAALFLKWVQPAAPLLLTLQEGDSLEHIYRRMGWFRWLFRLVFKKADQVQAISNYLAQWAREIGAKAPIEVVPNGANLRHSEAEGRRIPEEILRSAQDDESSVAERFVITVSRLEPKNGVADLIKSVSYLPGVVLLIVGGGSLDKELKKLAQDLGVAERVKFFGEVDPNDVSRYLRMAEVFCRPSLSEGLGSAFLEAMAIGLPVVGTPVGGIPDFLKDGETGLFCEPGNPESIAAAIKRLLDDSVLRERIAANGRKLIREKYDWDSIAGRMNQIFERKPMKVLIAADIFPPESGGPATYAVTLANELVKQGIEVVIVSLNPNSNTKVVTCPVFTIKSSFKPLRYWQYYKLLLAKGRDADVIYAMGPVNAGWPALRAAKKLGKKFVVKVVGDYAWEQGQVFGLVKDSIDDFQKNNYGGKVGWLKKVEAKVVLGADAIIVPCLYLQEMVMGWGAPKSKINVIHNAIEYVDVSAAPKPAKEKWIVSVARLLPWKGMDALIEIMPEIVKQVPETKLKIVGDGPEFENLKFKVQSLKLEQVVELTGRLPKIKTLEYIKAADVFVLNSGYEGLSHVILEAWSYRKPVLASDVAGNRESVVPGHTGHRFPFNDQTKIKELILMYLQDQPYLDFKDGLQVAHQSRLADMIENTKKFLEHLCAS